MIGGAINLKAIRTHWNEILRLATSIKQGASLMLRKLGSYSLSPINDYGGQSVLEGLPHP